MGYSLYLRRREASQPLDPGPLEAALTGLGAVKGDGRWDLKIEGARVQARLAGEVGKLEGIDLEIPFGGPEADYRAALLVAASAASKVGLSLMDPQLGAEVGPGNAEDSVIRWRESNRYALDTAGLSEDPRRDLPVEPQGPALRPWVKVLGLAVGGLLVVATLLNWLMTSLTSAPKPID